MKFMKLGSKSDSFQSEGENIRYISTDLATDITISTGDTKFHLHKFPLLSKSSRLQKLITGNCNSEIKIPEIPGGPAAFELCAKFCYGITVTLNAYNVVAARCAADYLEMYESIEKGNLVFKIEFFLTTSIFRSWKDSIIVLRTAKSFLPMSEDLKIVTHSLHSIATKACMEVSKVEWSYSYNWKKLSSRKKGAVPEDWWVEDLCELEIDMYKRVIETIKSFGKINYSVIGEALRAYTFRRLPLKSQCLVEAIISLLPIEKGSVHCRFLFELLKFASLLECEEIVKFELMKRIAGQLEKAEASDLVMIRDVEMIKTIVSINITEEMNGGGILNVKLAKLVDNYLAEMACDPNLTLSNFVDLAEMVSKFPRASHDGLYRAIDIYLQKHTEMSKTERKRICGLMDCRKLTSEACAHAVENERLPLRVIVQVVFFDQARTSISSGFCSTPDPDILATNPDEEDSGNAITERGLKVDSNKDGGDKAKKGSVMSKLFLKLRSLEDRKGECNSGSDTCESPADTKSNVL